MKATVTLGIDLAKNSFSLHGISADGTKIQDSQIFLMFHTGLTNTYDRSPCFYVGGPALPLPKQNTSSYPAEVQ